MSSPLQSGAASIEFAPLAGVAAAVGLDVSRTAGHHGTQARVALASSRDTALSANASLVRRTSGYRELTDAVRSMDAFTPPSLTQFAAMLGWRDRALGMLSPYEIRDTFALASVGERADIELATPSGPVWTDRHGRAVIASLPAYAQTFIRIDTKSLPRNLDLKNGIQTVEAGRGSASRVEFAVEQTPRVLLTVAQADGTALPVLSTLIDDDDHFVTVTGSEGKLLLTGAQLTTPLRVALPDGTLCRLTFALPDTPPATTRYYERADARCESSPEPVAHATHGAQKKSGMPTAMPPTPTLFFSERA